MITVSGIRPRLKRKSSAEGKASVKDLTTPEPRQENPPEGGTDGQPAETPTEQGGADDTGEGENGHAELLEEYRQGIEAATKPRQLSTYLERATEDPALSEDGNW